MTSGRSTLVAVFMASLLTATFLGSKLTEVFGITVSVGLFIFPFTFVALETAAEVYGKAFSASIIRIGLGVQIFVLGLIAFGGVLPVSPARDIGDAYEKMFGLAPRMILASVVAYGFSQFVDLSTFLRMREATHGRHLWLRANIAILLSQAVDTGIFMGIFLGGVLPLEVLVKTALAAYSVKIAVGALDTPFVYLGVRAVRFLDRRSERGTGNAEAMVTEGIRTRTFLPKDSLEDFVAREIEAKFGGAPPEETVIAITSKIVSIAEDRFVAKKKNATEAEQVAQKRAIVAEESDRFLGETLHGVALTIKHGILIPSAGVDESNSADGRFILFPIDPYASAERLGRGLRKRWGMRKLGLIITDSHTQPLRKGVTGIGLSHWGFIATKNYVGRKDLFGRAIKMTHVNALDALAVAAVYVMGETDESKPIAVIRGAGVEFTDRSSVEEIRIPVAEDLYGHLLFPAKK